MKTTQNIYNKLFSKTKLNSQRNVKFSLADDLNTAYEEAESTASNVSMQVEAAYEMVADAIGRIPSPDSFLEDVDASAMRLEMVLTEARSAAGQLGVDPRDIPGFTEAEEAMKSLDAVSEIVARYEDEISPILRFGGL